MKCNPYLMSDETLFSNKGVFEFDYTPEHLNYQVQPGLQGPPVLVQVPGGLVAVLVQLIGGGGLG